LFLVGFAGFFIVFWLESGLVESLRKLKDAPIKHVALYNLLLDCGLRLFESVNLINKFKSAEQEKGFYRCMVGGFRENKQAYYGHFSDHSLKLIKQVHEELDPRTSSHYFFKAWLRDTKICTKILFRQND
jgi:coproporphyrinogen III oxidase-like Fe-S oxidoreductase